MKMKEYKVVVTVNDFGLFAKISFLESGDKEEIFKKYMNKEFEFNGKHEVRDVRIYNR
jgi:hypothetical protein